MPDHEQPERIAEQWHLWEGSLTHPTRHYDREKCPGCVIESLAARLAEAQRMAEWKDKHEGDAADELVELRAQLAEAQLETRGALNSLELAHQRIDELEEQLALTDEHGTPVD